MVKAHKRNARWLRFKEVRILRSAEERNATWYKALVKLRHGFETDIECFYQAKVVRYDKKKHLADIQPLANFADGTKSAQYLDIPVSENCYKLDELLHAFKSSFAAVDQNSSLSEHTATSFIAHYPKHDSMRAGATVVVAVLDRDSDNWDGGSDTFTPATSRTHDANDSVIIGVLS